ncbi:MAG: GGDEF domain-containing protein [Deltaproteobacteria bacterium]|nr:GGDEF domain-containing protein [Deltaproteobacteria bacterium]MBT6436310.1 GGDEF domain-containing protein [Deltaproteobacteria bacterium]MBT6488156.1 GGDEF domain-containing protein [Deltaproteobacteria bacterium]
MADSNPNVAGMMKTQSDDNSITGSFRVDELLGEISRLKREVSELREIRNIAYIDALTGLPNRRYFEQRLSEAMASAEREPDKPLSVVVLDMDHLKLLNDDYGHAEGDRALVHFATRMQDALRDGDTCCRVGGDEFMIILPNCSHTACLELMERLAHHCRPDEGDFPVALRLSMGAATTGEGHVTVGGLCELADQRMYEDKVSRRGKVRPPADAAARLSASVIDIFQTVAMYVPPVAWPQIRWERVDSDVLPGVPGLALLDRLRVSFRDRKHEFIWDK